MSKPEDTLLGAQIVAGDDDVQKKVDERIRAVVREELAAWINGTPGLTGRYDTGLFFHNHSHTIAHAVKPVMVDWVKNGMFFR